MARNSEVRHGNGRGLRLKRRKGDNHWRRASRAGAAARVRSPRRQGLPGSARIARAQARDAKAQRKRLVSLVSGVDAFDLFFEVGHHDVSLNL